MSEKAIGRIHAVCLSIRPLRDPALTIKEAPVSSRRSPQIQQTGSIDVSLPEADDAS